MRERAEEVRRSILLFVLRVMMEGEVRSTTRRAYSQLMGTSELTVSDSYSIFSVFQTF